MFDLFRQRIALTAAIVAVTLLVAAAPRVPQTKTSANVQPAAKSQPQIATSSTPPSIAFSDPDGQELILEDLSVRTAIDGMLSLTEIEFRFRNPRPQRIEGRFSCTLPADAAISRFAKEVNGQLMEGEVVERLRANQVYEQFLHRMRDPALLEQDQGNRFSARIFPIEANAPVRLVLSYTSLLPMRSGVRSYSFPLRGIAKIGHFRFRGFVNALPGEQENTSARAGIDAGTDATRSSTEVVTIEKSDYTPERDIELSWRPTTAAPNARYFRAGDFYLAAFRPDVLQQKNAATPHDWLFYVDTSASSAEGAAHRARALQVLLGALPAADRVELRAFDQEIVTLKNGTASEVSSAIATLLDSRHFLGGTDLQALSGDIARAARERRSRAIVVASDFVATLGATESKNLTDAIRAIPGDAIVDALILGSREDSSVAATLTRGRGRVVRVPFTDAIQRKAAEAAAELAKPLGGSFEAVDENAEWIYPGRADDVQPGDEVIVLAKLKAGAEPEATLRPSPTSGTKTETVAANGNLHPRPQTLGDPAYATLLEREAYRAYLGYLAEREANEPSEAVRRALVTEQVKVSVEQRVVTPRTTMLVLETEWDYQRFGLDRRALAAILTIDGGGIGRVDRKSLPPAIPAPVAIAQDRARAKTENRVKDVQGVVGAVDATQPARELAANAPAPPPPLSAAPSAIPEAQKLNDSGRAAVAEAITVTAASPSVVGGVITSTPGGRGRIEPGGNSTRIVTAANEPPAEVKRPKPAWMQSSRPSSEELAELRKKLQAEPEDREVYNQLGEGLAARGEWKSLRELAFSWQRYDPENPQVYELLGRADEALGNSGEASRANASLIEIAPGKPELLQRAGLLLLRDHRASLAETPLRRALELRPDRVNSYRHLALMLWMDGRVEEAARVLERATRQSFPQWYGNAQRVVHEELGYVYRAWIAKAPERATEIAQRARENQVDLSRSDRLRVTLAWETDANDVDLHVVDPSGEECFYGHRVNASGIQLYEDITQGLGPEVIRGERIPRGKYSIGVKYFAAGPMGVSRGIVVVMHDDGGKQPAIDIQPFRLVQGGGDIRYVTSVVVN